MTTLPARLERAAGTGRAVTFVRTGPDESIRVSWAQLHEEARSVAGALQARGIGPGDHVCLLGPTSRELVTAIQATWLAGAAVIVLPLPMRLSSVEEFVAQTRLRIACADAAVVLADPALAEFLAPEPGDPPAVLFPELARAARSGRGSAYETVAHDPERLAIIQYTSGSTADPKGVMLPHATVCANLDAITTAAHLRADEDVLMSWLPLYHDMGLIGLLTLPMTSGTELALAAPQDFLAAPARWMEWVSRYRATATAGPNFAYALAGRALRRLDGLDLSSWRLGLNGAEPVDPGAVEAFVDAGARHGLDPRSVLCAFGMAEATLAVTFPTPGTGMRVDTVDSRVLETDRFAAPVDPSAHGSRRFARLGRPLPGFEIRILDPGNGRPMAEREVGELEIRGASVTPGYYRRPDATAEVMRPGGWLRTGDLAYLVEGELVVCGRIKDVIIVGGRNVFPEDVERAVATVDGVRAGNVIAFGIEGRRRREALVVVAESRADHPARSTVRDEVARRVREAVGLPADEVVLVRPGSLPKTTSGKLQRSLCRDRYLRSALEPE